MSKVTVSPTFEVIIPREVREELSLQPGQELEVFRYDGRIELVPILPMNEMRGFLPGIDTSLDRDPDRL
jgi:AbrB family looped-hinge helix DNA binding protein